ncbi:MAG: alpha/beta hydrolase family esterase [Isosphaeraceae bacterium]
MTPGSIFLVTACTVAASLLPPGDHLRELRVGDQVRSYLIHIPPLYDSRKSTPVVLALHSAMMNAATMARFCGLNEKADQAGFVAVYPNGTGSVPLFLYWDAGGVRGRVSDDVGYVAKLLDDLATVVNVDPRRIFATGMSNGAMMCYRLAAELSERIAAIAPVAGTMAIDQCQPSRPVSVLHFHGTNDGLVLFGGPGERTPKNLKFLSVDETIRVWVKANGCPQTPEIAELRNFADDGTTVRRKWHGPGKEGSEVVLYVIEGGGHTWPGRDPRLRLLGKSTREISANDLMWEFFQKHPMK